MMELLRVKYAMNNASAVIGHIIAGTTENTPVIASQ
jgi:hypothetical protein